MTDTPDGRTSGSPFAGALTNRRRLEPGDVLIRQDEATDTVYILSEGAVEVSRQFEEGETVLAIVDEPGSVIGEIVAMAGGARTATVTAVEPTDVIELTSVEFQRQLTENPDLADELVAMALRRVEQVELTEILSRHFGVADEDTLAATCERVELLRLSHGETLLRQGEESDSVYIVVRGRLAAAMRDSAGGSEERVGEMGRGDVVGEIGLLGNQPRNASVTAVRDSVVARMDEDTFRNLLESRPSMVVDLALKAVARSQRTPRHSAPNTVLAIAGCRRSPLEKIVDLIESELERFGSVRRLSPGRVDGALATPGIFDAGRGELGDVRVSRLVNEVELEADHLLVEVGESSGSWSRRALGMADRVLMVVPPDLTPTEADELKTMLGDCPVAVQRTLVVARPSGGAKPGGSALLRHDFGAENVVNIAVDSTADAARLARVAVGRGNTLVLSGGGGRGFAHIGVYRALTELGFPIDIVGGTSMGAIIGCVIADAFSPGEILVWAHEHFPRILDYTIPIVSLTKGDRIARSARATFGDRDIEDLWRTCFAVSTDLTTSRVHVHDTGSLRVAIRATSAIPGVMPPVPLKDSLLIDGGVLNNLPIDIARARSPLGRLIAVDVAPPRGPGAHGDFGLSVSGWQALRANLGARPSRYPRISAVLMRSMITASMLERDTQVDRRLADLYMDLDIRGVSMLAFDDPSGVAERGYDIAMPQIEAWLSGSSEPAGPTGHGVVPDSGD